MVTVNWVQLLPLLMADREDIKSHPLHRWVTAPEIHFDYRWIGFGYLPLGDALHGWVDGSLLRSCPDCNAQAYVLSASGGQYIGGWKGVCPRCQKEVGEKEGVREIVLQPQVRRHLVSLGYMPVLSKRDPWYFSFSRGGYRLGERENDALLEVPSWSNFVKGLFPDVLTET